MYLSIILLIAGCCLIGFSLGLQVAVGVFLIAIAILLELWTK